MSGFEVHVGSLDGDGCLFVVGFVGLWEKYRNLDHPGGLMARDWSPDISVSIL